MPLKSLLPVGLLVGFVALAPPAHSQLSPVGPVVNGDFELVVPGGQALCDAVGDQEINLILVIVDTCKPGAMKALHWSSQDGMEFGDCGCDGDPDREALIPSGTGVSNHNFWQAWPSPHQAFSGRFASYEFDVESGAVPAAANIQVGFSLTPLQAQHPYAGVFWDGAIHFTSADMVPDGSGHVSMSPVDDGSIMCPAFTPCQDFKAAFDAASASGKADLLGRVRIVQDSFWNFNLGAGPVVVDNVSITGATTVAEEVAAGNVNPNPYGP